MGLFENARTKYCDVIAENVTEKRDLMHTLSKKIKVYILQIYN